MRLVRKLLFSFPILFFLLIFSPRFSSVLAEGEFETNYNVVYSVSENGRTTVNQDIILKNKTSNYYADKFELKIGSTKVEEVKASDNVGPMEVSATFDNNTTTITVKFNQKVIGLGKTLPWKLSYSSSELSTKSGQIWEVSIPRLAKSADLGSYDAKVSVPMSFGPNAFAVPIPRDTTKNGFFQVFSFDKDQLTTSGISMSFGQKQVFEYTLSYFLENNNFTARTSEITLPPDNNYQKVVINKIEPSPKDVKVDPDGNFIASFRLAPKEKINVTVEGYVEVFSKPFRNIDQKLTTEDRQKYLSPQKYWEVDSSLVKDKAKSLKTPKEIYDFVSNYLSYSQSKLNSKVVERLGAAGALTTPKDSVCMEFTDLFIALSRSAGIPAKEIVGYAYTQNTRLRPLSFAAQGDLLHAWPAYWDDNLGWVEVDPTWGSTSGGLDYFNKLDFNHITLAQRGLSSTFPYPAGSYKQAGSEDKKDVFITFAADLPQITSTPQLSLIAPTNIVSGMPTIVTAEITNIGSTSILGGQISLEATNLQVKSKNHVELGVLPPFSKRQVTFNLQGKNFMTNRADSLVLTFGDVQIAKPVSIVPFYYLILSKNFLISLSVSVAVIVLGLFLFFRLHHKKA